jgi:hypothetical protein
MAPPNGGSAYGGMTVARTWGALAGGLAGGKLALPLGPGRWHVLFGGRPRPLLVPATGLSVQRHCLRHFIAKPLHRLAADLLLRLNARLPVELLPELRSSRSVCDARAAGRNGASMLRAPCAAIQIGTPGAYQKAAALLMTEAGRPFALAKIALQRRADLAIETETRWLRALAQVQELEGQVPRLLEEGTTEAGRRYLITSLAPSTAATREFTPRHARFLAALRRVSLKVEDWELSARARWLQAALGQIAPRIGAAERAQLQAALEDYEGPLLYWSGPYVASQGDFAPWNIRVAAERIFVFDWETGSEGTSPLDDVLHFRLIDRAVHGRALRAAHMKEAMLHAGRFAADAYPEWEWRPGVVSAFALGYLLGVVLRYATADGRINFQDPVIQRYWSLMKERRAWMAH